MLGFNKQGSGMNGDENGDIQADVKFRYVVAGIALSCVTMTAIVVVSVFTPEHDHATIIAAIIAVAGGTYPSLASFIRAQANAEELRKAKRLQDKEAAAVKQALEEANSKIDRSNREHTEHLEKQDQMLDTVVRQTNGLIDKIEEKARNEAFIAGEKVALQKLGIEPRRVTDK